jgi:hypothetical protein
MKYICPLCSINSSSHSLTEIAEIDNVLYYYTCPAKAELYFDKTSILHHYDGVFGEIPINKQWVWIFDGSGFNLNHFLQIEIGIELTKLVSQKFSKNLKSILVINPTFYISSVYNIIYPFLSEKMKSIVQVNYDYKNDDNIEKSELLNQLLAV